MKKPRKNETALHLNYEKLLQDYQILMTSIVTYWIALMVGIIIAIITEKFFFGIFFVLIIGISVFLTIVGIFELALMKENLLAIISEVKEN